MEPALRRRELLSLHDLCCPSVKSDHIHPLGSMGDPAERNSDVCRMHQHGRDKHFMSENHKAGDGGPTTFHCHTTGIEGKKQGGFPQCALIASIVSDDALQSNLP